MNNKFGISLIAFFMATVLAASALPTMAGRLKAYNGKTGILILQLEDKTERKFQLTEKTICEWMGRTTSPAAIRQGAKISIQIAGDLSAPTLKAAKIVDWGNSDTIVAKGAVAPYYTAQAQYASTDGNGGMPDGAPLGNNHAHQDMAAVAQGGSQNMAQAPPANQPYNSNNGATSTSGTSYPSASNQAGSVFYSNQGQSLTAPLENMGIDPYSSNPNYNTNPSSNTGNYTQMGAAQDIGSMMGTNSEEGGNNDASFTNPMPGMETAYGGGVEKITGQVLEAQLDQGWVLIQAFEHPNVIRVLLNDVANAPMQYLTPGNMIEVTGSQSPQGFRAREVKVAGGSE